MPSAKKVAWSQLRVGIMAVVAMVILGILIFLLTGGGRDIFAKNATVYTFLDDSAALTEGSAVRLNGIVIGKVSKVALSGSTDPRRIVRINLDLPVKMLPQIPVDSMAAISAENVLGTKYINIKKGRSPASIQPGQELPSLDTREFEEVVQSGYALMTSLQGIIRRVDAIIGKAEAGQGSIGKLFMSDELYNRLLAVTTDLQKVSQALNSPTGTLGRLLYDDSLYEEVRSPVARLDNLLEELQAGQGTAGKFLKDPVLYDEMRQTLAEVRSLLNDLNAGKGTAGKLLNSDELHRQILGTIAKIDTTIDRLNSGQGTLGQLLANPALYDSLNIATREFHDLLKDFRANPKKFLYIRLGLF